MTEYIHSGADISQDGKYRYALRRAWPPSGGLTVNFIGLNPSTADATQDDPTVRRCVGFAKHLGFDRLIITNLFAWRTSSPVFLRGILDPVGPENNDAIRTNAVHSNMVVLCWGHRGTIGGRDLRVLDILGEEGLFSAGRVNCFGKTSDGSPRHPLYLRKDTPLVPWP